MAGMSDAALGLDDRYGTHAYDKCSYAGYVAEQFYQYAAAMKMVYVLATDEAARSQLIDAINEGISGSSVVRFLSSASNEFAAQRLQDPLLIEMVTGASSDAVASALGLPGSRPESDFDLDEINSIHQHLAKQRLNSARYQAEKQRAMSDLKDGATSYWREIKRRHSECGFMYAALTVSTDGAFVLGGLALGAGLGAAAIKAMRSIKFFAARVVNGKIKVTAKHDLTGGKIERDFTTKELEEDFGTPDKNHAGTSDNEANVPTGEGKKKTDDGDKGQDSESNKEESATKPPPQKTIPRQYGKNENNITYDTATGRPTRAQGVIREDFGGMPRGDNATDIGRMGNPGDDGGHLAGHRFFGDTPDQGIVPQASNLNRGAWKTMENEWADWIKKGYNVEYDIKVIPPGAVRPDAFKVKYKIVDPNTGAEKYSNDVAMRNRAGETFDRVKFRDME